MEEKKLASQILDEIGDKENIKEVFHCVTRLRFYLKDRAGIDLEKIKAFDGVLGAQYQGEQLQIIIGNEVDTVYSAVVQKTGAIHSEENVDKKKKFKVNGIFETMAAILLPVVPVLAGAGMIKGIITILTSYCGVNPTSDMVTVLTIIGDGVFYFFPFLIAWSASKRFKTDTACALALAAALLYPTMTAGLAAGSEPLNFLGLPIPFVKYASSSIPIILSVWVLSYVYRFVDNHIHKSIKLVFTPMIVLTIMIPVMLIGIAPLASYASKGLVVVVSTLYEFSPLVAGAIVGGTRLLVVLTGMHMSLSAICVENISQFGSDFLLPLNTMGTLALVGVTLGVWLKSKKSETKSVAMSSFVSAVIGITEPGIYGVLLKFKKVLISAMIAGAVSGAFVAMFGGRATAYVNSCLLSLPVFVGDGFWAVCVGMLLAAVIGCVLVLIFGFSEENKGQEEVCAKQVVDKDNEVIFSPMTGKIVKIEDVKEEIFSSGKMGKGIAIDPEDGVLVAPFDGVVTTIYPTKHAIGLTSNQGVECIIHIGVDTANLQGKYFDIKVEQGQNIEKGDLIVEVDLANVLKEGYSIITPIIIVNSVDFLDVLPNEEQGLIMKGESLLTVLK